MSDKPLLYSYWISSCSWRVRIALAFKNIEHDYACPDLNNGEQHNQKYLDVNPSGMVPCFVHKGKPIGESMAILEYLEEEFKDSPKLLLEDTYERAVIRSIVLTIISGIQPLQNTRALHYHTKDKEEQFKMANYFINLGLKIVEKKLEKTAGKYSVGDTITMADVALFPQVFNGTTAFGGVNLDDYPVIKKVVTNLSQIEAFVSTNPYVQPDTPKEFKGREFSFENDCLQRKLQFLD